MMNEELLLKSSSYLNFYKSLIIEDIKKEKRNREIWNVYSSVFSGNREFQRVLWEK